MSPFDKTSLPEKVYLSGADCFHLVLDKHAKKHGAGGNVMRKVFYFNNALGKDKIESILKSSPVIYWLCNIKLIQGSLFKIPYWKYADNGNGIILREHKAVTENEIPAVILKRDITMASAAFIEADLVHYPAGGCAFILSWNHILLDAKGTTLLFDHLGHIADNMPGLIDNFFPKKEKGPGILNYISNMYKVKSFIQHSSRPPVSSVATSIKISGGDTQYKTLSFSTDETEKITANASRSGARFGPTLYFIACCSHVIHAINKKRNNEGDLWLPVPYDGRLRGAPGPLISNCVSFLFYRIPKDELNNVPQTVKCLSAQMTEQIRDKIPQRYTMFLNMMRHVPLWLYYFLISRTGKGVFASFLYTSTGDHFNELKTLFDEPLRDLTMVPALTFPPGLTFVFLKQNDALNVNIAWSPAVVNDNDLLLIDQKLKELLLSDH
ncbi:MAG TPA: hypothetical protein VK489_05495 [Ferruginibacter sp.]|nr:hypothetical protein [Ferruginibacter sp.]